MGPAWVARAGRTGPGMVVRALESLRGRGLGPVAGASAEPERMMTMTARTPLVLAPTPEVPVLGPALALELAVLELAV